MGICVHKFMNMYIHVCTMFRHVYTVLPYHVQGGRIPNGISMVYPWIYMVYHWLYLHGICAVYRVVPF